MKLHELLLSAANIAQMPTQEKRHFLNPNAIRLNRSLGDAVGLKNRWCPEKYAAQKYKRQ